MKKMFCNECKNEIVITIEKPISCFIINENGFEREDNNINDTSRFHLHCSHDITHDIYPKSAIDYVKFQLWEEEIKKQLSKDIKS